MQLQYGPFNYYDLTQFRPGLSWSCANNNSPSNKSGIQSCISYRITDDIHVILRNHIINNWVNEQFTVLLCWNIYTHMHGLIFETSIWLLAGSTRFSHYNPSYMNQSSMLQPSYVNQSSKKLYTWINIQRANISQLSVIINTHKHQDAYLHMLVYLIYKHPGVNKQSST